LHVATSAEAPAGPGEDDHAHLRVAGEPRERLEHRAPHRPGHGVEPVGTIQGEHGDSILDDFQQILAHWRDPPEVTVSPPMVPSRRRGGAPWKPSNAKGGGTRVISTRSSAGPGTPSARAFESRSCRSDRASRCPGTTTTTSRTRS